MDNNKKGVFQIDSDLLQEFFNKDNSSSFLGGGGGGASFYESDHDNSRFGGFAMNKDYYGNFDNFIHQSNPYQGSNAFGG